MPYFLDFLLPRTLTAKLFLSAAEQEWTFGQLALIAVIGFVLVILVLGVITLLIKAIGIGVDKFNAGQKVADNAAVASPQGTVAGVASVKVPAPGSVGEIALHDVPEETAAMLMAIVADRMDVPLNELRFRSIREIKDDE
ncbi:MAG: hypothetical protein GX900_00600 [Clostridiaceae bacterium]|nr:hypothetical protein [Clostridiaceae bacterium]